MNHLYRHCWNFHHIDKELQNKRPFDLNQLNVFMRKSVALSTSSQNFTPAEQLIKEREQEQFSLERQAWEQHCERLHQEVSSLTTLCNGLLRDQQMLVSTVIGRNVPSGPSSSGFANIPGAMPGLGKPKHNFHLGTVLQLR